jgi:tetratricopeptide (TPR) repeat protein
MTGKLGFLFISLLFTSCVSVSVLNVQVLEPASNPSTVRIDDALILNRAIFESAGVNVDTLDFESETKELYNQTTTEIVFALADILNESPSISFIDTSRILEIPLRQVSARPKPLEPGYIRFLCDSLNTNAVFSFDLFYITIPEAVMVTSVPDGTYQGYYYEGEIDVYISALWRVYEMPEGNLTEEINWFDTLTWSHASYSTEEISANMPTPDKMFFESAYFTALSFARKISPYWVTVPRKYFFRGNRILRNAAYDLIDGQFDEARLKYESLLEKQNQNIVAAALYNISLIYEIEGDYRLAHNWARRSYQNRQHPVTSEYIDILERRLEKADELDRQVGKDDLK